MVSLGLGQKQLQGPPLPPQVQQVLETQSGGVGGKLMQWPPALSAHQPRGQPWASSRSNISAPLLFETRHAAEPHPSPQHPPQFSPALAASGGLPTSGRGGGTGGLTSDLAATRLSPQCGFYRREIPEARGRGRPRRGRGCGDSRGGAALVCSDLHASLPCEGPPALRCRRQPRSARVSSPTAAALAARGGGGLPPASS